MARANRQEAKTVPAVPVGAVERDLLQNYLDEVADLPLLDSPDSAIARTDFSQGEQTFQRYRQAELARLNAIHQSLARERNALEVRRAEVAKHAAGLASRAGLWSLLAALVPR